MKREQLGRVFLIEAEQRSESDAPPSSELLRVPTVEERARLYLHAVHGSRDFTSEEVSDARNQILGAMATDLATRSGISLTEAFEGTRDPDWIGGADDVISGVDIDQPRQFARAAPPLRAGAASLGFAAPPLRAGADFAAPPRFLEAEQRTSHDFVGASPKWGAQRFWLGGAAIGLLTAALILVFGPMAWRSLQERGTFTDQRPTVIAEGNGGQDDAAADDGFMGQPLPTGQPTRQTTSVIADWQSVVLDGLQSNVIRDTLAKVVPDHKVVKTRGAKDVAIYKNASSSVVLVATSDGLGSGTYLGRDVILTNWHVVKGFRQVGVLFKPSQEGGKIDSSAMVRADVMRADPVRDLALLKVAVVPPTVHPLELGTEAEIQVGADVHAIGHPVGEAWTYTKGLISQIRRDYEWQADGDAHRADVIQTQTPINPGNSGGPLLGESGKLIGINSFKEGGEGLNFAVSLDDITAFLTSPNRQASPPSNACKPTQLYEGRNQENTGVLTQIDSDCDGKADISVLLLDDKSKPRMALIDSNFDGKIDVVVDDIDRDGKWDISFHDVDFEWNHRPSWVSSRRENNAF